MRPHFERLESRFLLAQNSIGAHVLGDLNSVPTALHPRSLHQVAGAAVFVGDSPAGTELWRTDGTAEGTYLLKEFSPGAASTRFDEFIQTDSFVFFNLGAELWRTDGTEAGTIPLPGNFRGAFQTMGEQLIFSDYLTDGTMAGTHQFGGFAKLRYAFVVGENFLIPHKTSSRDPITDPHVLVSVEGTKTGVDWDLRRTPAQLSDDAIMYWQRNRLRITDGSEAGTYDVEQPAIGFPNHFIDSFEKGHQTISAWRQGLHNQIWMTQPGVSQVDVIASFPHGRISEFTFFDDQYWFTVTDEAFGRELWLTDGTTEGTRRFIDLHPGEEGSDPQDLLVYNDRLYFSADDGIHGREPWVTDGVHVNLLEDIEPGHEGSNPELFDDVGGVLLFAAERGSDRELWRSDGTVDGTFQLDVYPSGATYDSDPSHLIAYGNHVYFSANDGERGHELWRTNGVDSIELVKDFLVGQRSSQPRNFRLREGQLYFDVTRNGIHTSSTVVDEREGRPRYVRSSDRVPAESHQRGDELYFLDDRDDVIQFVRRSLVDSSETVLYPSRITSQIRLSHLVDRDGALIFAEFDNGRANARILRFDADTETIQAVGRLPYATEAPLLVANDDLLLWVPENPDDAALASFVDGSLEPIALPIRPTELKQLTPQLALASDGDRHFVTDGTIAGTREIADRLVAVAPVGDHVVTLDYQNSTLQLRVGNQDLTKLVPLRAFDGVKEPAWVTVQNRLVFAVNRSGSPQIWVSDGTVMGTGLVANVVDMAADAAIEQLTIMQDRLVFVAEHQWLGTEIWTTPLHPVGDVNGDGMLTAEDIDQLVAAVRAGTDNEVFDIHVDDVVDSRDIETFVQRVLVTEFGDADLDGDVDMSDYRQLLDHFGQQAGWERGDFNGDNVVDFADFILLSRNWTRT